MAWRRPPCKKRGSATLNRYDKSRDAAPWVTFLEAEPRAARQKYDDKYDSRGIK